MGLDLGFIGLLRLIDCWMRQRPGVVGHGPKVANFDPAAGFGR